MNNVNMTRFNTQILINKLLHTPAIDSGRFQVRNYDFLASDINKTSHYENIFSSVSLTHMQSITHEIDGVQL